MDFLTALEGYWLARRREMSPNTVNDYSLTFRRFATFIGNDRLLSDIQSADIHRFLNHLKSKQKLSDKTLSNVWTALSSFWTWAEMELKVPHLIRGAIPRPQYRRAPIEAYTEVEIRSLLAACDYAAGWDRNNGRRSRAMRPTALRDRTMIIVLVDTGIRVSELCDLTLRDYENKSGRLTIQHGKGDKKRVVFVGNTGQRQLWRYLATRPAARQDDPLFATRTGQPLDRHTVRHLIERTGQRAGVPNANVHKFRHTFAVNFLRNGGNVLELQKLLGHEKMDTVRIYVELANTDLANAQRVASPADNWRL